MPVSYQYNSDEKVIEVSCSGHLALPEILGYYTEIAADRSIELEAVEIVDLSRVEHFDVDFSQVPTMPANYATAHGIKKILGTILFGTTTFNRGLAQLIQVHFKKTLPDHFFAIAPSAEWAWGEARRLRANRC